MLTTRNLGAFLMVLAVLGASAGPARAQAAAQATQKEPPKLGWSNTTDFSLVVTNGNSSSRTIGFSEKLWHVWPNARFDFEAMSVRSDNADDRYFLVDPGLEFAVGSAPVAPPISLVKPAREPDTANYLVGGRYQRNITPRFFWNTGASWDRNEDAGILARYIVFGGLGNTWIDIATRRFVTDYGISYTDRKEEEPDPEKERRFAGARAGYDYMDKFDTTSTTFTSVLTSNLNLVDATDFSINTTHGVAVAMNNHLALKASLQLLYENEPALATDLDVIAFVELINPDGIPSSGDERYRTVTSGGTQIVVGSADARRDKLDTIVRTSLVVTF
jgi:hypothetical protein